MPSFLSARRIPQSPVSLTLSLPIRLSPPQTSFAALLRSFCPSFARCLLLPLDRPRARRQMRQRKSTRFGSGGATRREMTSTRQTQCCIISHRGPLFVEYRVEQKSWGQVQRIVLPSPSQPRPAMAGWCLTKQSLSFAQRCTCQQGCPEMVP